MAASPEAATAQSSINANALPSANAATAENKLQPVEATTKDAIGSQTINTRVTESEKAVTSNSLLPPAVETETEPVVTTSSDIKYDVLPRLIARGLTMYFEGKRIKMQLGDAKGDMVVDDDKASGFGQTKADDNKKKK